MSHVDLRDAGGHDSGRPQASRQHLRPFEAMLIKLEELDTYVHLAVRQYPKHERHLLAADTRACSAQLLRLTITAWKRHHKKTTLSELDIEIETMRHLIRKAHRLRYINGHRYRTWAEHTNELGRMLGGWLKAEKARV